MSTLSVVTIQNATNIQGPNASTLPSFQDSTGVEHGRLCRAFVNYNGSTPGIRASFNISSVTKNGTGDYTFNFTNVLSDANYSAVASSTLNSVGQIDHIISMTNSACRFQRWDNSTGTITSDATIFAVSFNR